MMKKLGTYLDVYDNNDLVTFVKDDIKENKETLLKLLQL